ncbi:Alpha/Beta hydrolase protein [Podospora didyma]|uniref:Carboxylic ester hydrolase n=1 Tax=Podospora didyma TaxID=330526 RepID=A0AAE0NR01_9PEZI|nr:Alpha/Beta hydrolase protein [Podospora didyma]
MKPESWISRAAAALVLLLPVAQAASLVKVTDDFGANPTKVGFYIYVPDVLPSNPAILVNPHWCHGTAQAAYAGSQYATLASKHGFIVIYPNSPNAADQCWDVSSQQTLSHNGGGDSLGIVSMVKWTLNKYHGDASRVFVTGVSSGAMMTQVLVGSYPDIFAAGSAFSGVPFGCFAPAGNNSGVYGYWSDDCAKGKTVKTPEAWGAIVKAAYPGYSGWRPKLQIFHGTNDEVLNYQNHLEAVKEWTAVLGLSQTPTSVVQNTPVSGWTKSVYGTNNWFEAFSAAGVPHNIQVQENTVLAFFQLNCTASCFSWGQGGPSGAVPSTVVTPVVVSTTKAAASTTTSVTVMVSKTSSAPAAGTTTAAAGTGQVLYGQCGGNGYTGPSACAVGKCSSYNEWYSQCIPL